MRGPGRENRLERRRVDLRPRTDVGERLLQERNHRERIARGADDDDRPAAERGHPIQVGLKHGQIDVTLVSRPEGLVPEVRQDVGHDADDLPRLVAASLAARPAAAPSEAGKRESGHEVLPDRRLAAERRPGERLADHRDPRAARPVAIREEPAGLQASAGAVPNSRPATTDTAAVNASTAPSTPTSASPGTLRGTSAGAARTIPAATARPAVPPATLRTTLSVSSWRTIRPRPAPSAPRTASSRRRAIPRASSRPATLAHAISSTSPVAAASIRSAGRNGRPRSSRNDVTRVSTPKPGDRGPSGPARSRIVRTSVSACAGDTPSRSRPTPMNVLMMKSEPSNGASGSYGGTTSGVQISVP